MRAVGLLSSEVGRGHPFYLDHLEAALRVHPLPVTRASVFEVSTGLSHLAWRAVRAAYRFAGRGGRIARSYARARRAVDYERPSPALRLLGRGARRWAAAQPGVVVVDHPVLAAALGGRPHVLYMHGELVVPQDAVVKGAAATLVPWEPAAAALRAAGVPPERVLVTGLCLEPALAEAAAEQRAARRARVAGQGPLTGGFFSSGAEPRDHVAALLAAAESSVQAGHRALVFAARGGRLEAGAGRMAGATLVAFRGRAELDRVTADHFGELDFAVAPPHERSQWALGLRLPFFLVGPDIGPFAPLNRRVLLEHGAALPLEDLGAAHAFGARLAEWRRDGVLRGGEPMEPVDGFARAARAVADWAERA